MGKGSLDLRFWGDDRSHLVEDTRITHAACDSCRGGVDVLARLHRSAPHNALRRRGPGCHNAGRRIREPRRRSGVQEPSPAGGRR